MRGIGQTACGTPQTLTNCGIGQNPGPIRCGRPGGRGVPGQRRVDARMHCVQPPGQRRVVRNFDRLVVDFRAGAAVLNGFSARGISPRRQARQPCRFFNGGEIAEAREITRARLTDPRPNLAIAVTTILCRLLGAVAVAVRLTGAMLVHPLAVPIVNGRRRKRVSMAVRAVAAAQPSGASTGDSR